MIKSLKITLQFITKNNLIQKSQILVPHNHIKKRNKYLLQQKKIKSQQKKRKSMSLQQKKRKSMSLQQKKTHKLNKKTVRLMIRIRILVRVQKSKKYERLKYDKKIYSDFPIQII